MASGHLIIALVAGLAAPVAPSQPPGAPLTVVRAEPGLVSVFEQVCIDGPRRAADAVALLRRIGYAETGRPTDAMRWFSKSGAPSVQIAGNGFVCAVTAPAAAGDPDRVQEFVRRRFPAARSLAPATFGQGTQLAFATGQGRTMIVLKRIAGSGGAARSLVQRMGD